jgi:F0F1-type ATP synthase assembly protein I
MIPGTNHDGLWYHTFMDEKDRKLLRMLGVLSTVGLTLVFATVIGLFVGLKLDQWLGTSPWLTIVFLLFGLIAGFRNVVLYAIRSQKLLDEDDDKKS